MDRKGLHERSVQIAGNGYVETRQFWFLPNGEFALALISVVLTDGSKTDVSVINVSGVITTSGVVQYPDDTHLSTGFSADGRIYMSYVHLNSQNSTQWSYQPDGSGEVTNTEWLPQGGVATTFWSVAPDGAPVGDVREHVYVALEFGHKEVDTVRQKDGTVTTRTQVFNEHGEVVRDETTVAHFNPHPEVPSAEGTGVKRPAPVTGDGGGSGGGFEPTTRQPDPRVVVSGGGWVGGGGPVIVEHITDWWYRSPDGRVTYLGSTVNDEMKKE